MRIIFPYFIFSKMATPPVGTKMDLFDIHTLLEGYFNIHSDPDVAREFCFFLEDQFGDVMKDLPALYFTDAFSEDLG